MISLEKFHKLKTTQEKTEAIYQDACAILEGISKLIEQKEKCNSTILKDQLTIIVDTSAKLIYLIGSMLQLVGRYVKSTSIESILSSYILYSFEELEALGLSLDNIKKHLYLQVDFINRIRYNEALLQIGTSLIEDLFIECIYMCLIRLHLVFHLNDYKKWTRLLNASKASINSILGFSPGLSTITGFSDLLQNINEMAKTFDEKYLRESFFNEIDTQLQQLEKQQDLLLFSSEEQLKILESLSNIVVQAEKTPNDYRDIFSMATQIKDDKGKEN